MGTAVRRANPKAAVFVLANGQPSRRRGVDRLSPEMDYLKELWEKQDWSRLLEATKTLLLSGSWTAEELAYLNFYACRARFANRDFYAGLPSGELARRLAEDTGSWDLLANIYIALSAGYHWLMQYERSLEYAFAFLEKIPRFAAASVREGEAWFRVAMGYEGLNMVREAILAYERARKSLASSGSWHWYIMATRGMLNPLYRVDPERIPSLLAEMMQLRHRVRDISTVTNAILLERARYASFRQRYKVSLRLAGQCVDPGVSAQLTVEAHMVLSHCYRSMEEREAAMRHAVLARTTALQYGLFALEYSSVELIYALMKEQPNLAAGSVSSLGVDYLQSASVAFQGRDLH